MAHENYDPAKEPCSPRWYSDPECYPIAGPGGNTTLIENNEKGILETAVFRVTDKTTGLAPHAWHDERQGIYVPGAES